MVLDHQCGTAVALAQGRLEPTELIVVELTAVSARHVRVEAHESEFVTVDDVVDRIVGPAARKVGEPAAELAAVVVVAREREQRGAERREQALELVRTDQGGRR